MEKITVLIALVTITALLAPPAWAQVDGAARFGLKAGVVLTNLTGDDTENTDTKAGFAAGFFAHLPLSETVGFQTEALYVQKGAKATGTDPQFGTVDLTLKLDYVEIPFLLRADFPSRSNTFYLLVGPALGIKASSKLKVEALGAAAETDLDDIKSMDFSGVVGAGVEIGNGLIEVRYNLGLRTVDDSTEEADIKNSGLYLLAGMGF